MLNYIYFHFIFLVCFIFLSKAYDHVWAETCCVFVNSRLQLCLAVFLLVSNCYKYNGMSFVKLNKLLCHLCFVSYETG